MKSIRKIINEKTLVIILFVMVFITFSLAQRESRKIEKLYIGFKIQETKPLNAAVKAVTDSKDKTVFPR